MDFQVDSSAKIMLTTQTFDLRDFEVLSTEQSFSLRPLHMSKKGTHEKRKKIENIRKFIFVLTIGILPNTATTTISEEESGDH